MNAGLQTRSGSYSGSTYKPGQPPGLYEEIVPAVRPRLVRLDTAAFVGLAERGPVNTAVPLGSIAEFRAVFGRPVGGMLLPEAVNAFFANGGRRCLVVRALNHEEARTAKLEAPGFKTPFPLVARSPGAWANRLKLFVTLKRRALPLRLVEVNDDPDWPQGAIVAPAHRAGEGVTLRLIGPAPAAATVLRIVGASKPVRGTASVALSGALDPDFNGNPELLAATEELSVRLDVFLGDERVETWDDATFDPAHPNFLPRLLGRRAASEALLAPRVSGESEPDLAWGGEDDPAGSEMLRPGLSAAGQVLEPSPDLLNAPNGLMFDSAEQIYPLNGDDAAPKTGRQHFFVKTPPDPSLPDRAEAIHPFADRPGAVDALLPWDDRNAASPVALICIPDLLHPKEPNAEPDAEPPADAPCFGVCVHTPTSAVAPALPYPLLGDGLTDLQQRQVDLVQTCEALGRRIALLDLPPGLPAGDVVSWRRATASARAALFSPWLRAAPSGDPLREAIELPPSAAVAGLIARVERQTGVHLSPGAQTIQGVFGIADRPGQPDPGFLHAERIDAIRATEKGIQLMGSRTTSLDPDWTHINVRRIVDWLMAQLPLDLAWAPFEPNDPRLWAAMTRAAARRLNTLFDAGALAGATAERSWFVRCDRTTMSEGDLDEGRAIMLVGVAPAVPAEFLVFRLVREGGETQAAEVVA